MHTRLGERHRWGRIGHGNLGGQKVGLLDVAAADTDFVFLQEIARDEAGWINMIPSTFTGSHIVMLINGVVSRLALPWTSLTASFKRLPRKEASGSWPVSRIWGELFVDPSTPTLVLPMLFTKELFMSFSVLFLGVGVSTPCFAVLMPTKPVSGFRMMQR